VAVQDVQELAVRPDGAPVDVAVAHVDLGAGGRAVGEHVVDDVVGAGDERAGADVRVGDEVADLVDVAGVPEERVPAARRHVVEQQPVEGPGFVRIQFGLQLRLVGPGPVVQQLLPHRLGDRRDGEEEAPFERLKLERIHDDNGGISNVFTATAHANIPSTRNPRRHNPS
jgi:hypothetical protein